MYRIWKEEMRKIASGKIVWLGLILLPALLYLRLMSQVSTYRVTIDGEYFEGKEALMMDQKLTKEYAGPLTEEKVRQIYRDFGFCYWSQENGAVGNFCNKFITEEMTDFNEKGWENQDAISFYSGEDWENYVAPMLTGDIWFDYVDGWRDLREIYGIIVIIGLLLIFMVAVAPVFAEEYTLRTTDLVLTTKEGKERGSPDEDRGGFFLHGAGILRDNAVCVGNLSGGIRITGTGCLGQIAGCSFHGILPRDSFRFFYIPVFSGTRGSPAVNGDYAGGICRKPQFFCSGCDLSGVVFCAVCVDNCVHADDAHAGNSDHLDNFSFHDVDAVLSGAELGICLCRKADSDAYGHRGGCGDCGRDGRVL